MNRVDVAVLGAGVVGAAVAYELAGAGASVAVVERGESWGSGCSWGNAGFVSPSHAGHFAHPHDLFLAARWLLRPDRPFAVRPRPGLAPFMARLALAMRPATEARVRQLSRSLCEESLAMHAALAAGGIEAGFRRDGILEVYETADLLRSGIAHAGPDARVLSAQETRGEEPALGGRVAGGILNEGDAHCDPLRFVRGLGAAAEERGAALLPRREVFDLVPADGGVTVRTTAGDLAAETVVVAAGSWSGRVARLAGGRIPLEAGKGYTVDLEAETREPLRRPLILQEARLGVTPLEGRTRLAGTMAFDGLDTRIDRRRVAAVHAAGSRAMPGWAGAPVREVWSGLRPCSPDGLPIVGRLPGAEQVVVATGHAMLGLTLAPVTGRLVGELLAGRPRAELAQLSPSRF
jgi:D-amino-acid dehydrogenase